MKEKLHRLIDAIFGDESNEVQPVSKPHKPVKVFWRKPICKNNPLEQPKGETDPGAKSHASLDR